MTAVLGDGKAVVSRVRRRRRRLFSSRFPYLAVAPFFLVLLLFVIAPLGYSAYLSLFQSQLVGGVTFVGLNNYVRTFTDARFLVSLGHVALLLLVQVPIMAALALLLALLLDSGAIFAQKFFRLAIFLPYAIPSVVATLMWGYLYGHDYGPIAQVGNAVGIGTPDLLSPSWILGSIGNIVTWEFLGYNMIILYAALRTVPTELFEAARTDGASAARIAWSIKIPAIRQALILVLVFSVIGTFQTFNEPKLLAGIAPEAIGNSYTPNLYAYNLSFVDQNLNYAAAIAFVLGAVIMVLSYVFQRATEPRPEKNGEAL